MSETKNHDALENRGADKMETLIQNKFNIRDTKRYYSVINEKALDGIEIITYNAMGKAGEVSHINKKIIDFLFDSLKFHISEEYDDELNIWTVSVDDINIYGQGNTKEKAVENLVNSILEYSAVYTEKIDLFSKVEEPTKQGYMLKIIRCGNDKDKIMKELGL